MKEQIYWDLIDDTYPEYRNIDFDINYTLDSMAEFAQDNGIKYIDLRVPLMKDRSKLLYFAHDGHLTPIGNTIVADAIKSYLEENNMLN